MSLLDRTTDETFPQTRIATLETARLVLRAPRLEDAKPIAMLVNDRRIAENTARIPHPYVLDDATEWINARCGSDRNYVIVHEGEVIGACGIQMRGDAPELGYWLGVPFWGRGYATEAAHALIDHAFGDLGYAMLTAGARVSNLASRRVLQKCGFQWTATELWRIRAIRSSAPFDRFRLERAIWASLRNWGAVKRGSGV